MSIGYQWRDDLWLFFVDSTETTEYLHSHPLNKALQYATDISPLNQFVYQSQVRNGAEFQYHSLFYICKVEIKWFRMRFVGFDRQQVSINNVIRVSNATF